MLASVFIEGAVLFTIVVRRVVFVEAYLYYKLPIVSVSIGGRLTLHCGNGHTLKSNVT